MAFQLAQVVPWGRTFEEYERMFALSAADLTRSILGCGDGPASFNAEGTQRGLHITSVDPLYAATRAQIAQRIAETTPTIISQLQENKDDFVWDYFSSAETLVAIRTHAMQAFLEDYDAGRTAGRYLEAALPTLPFADGAFDLALCSHLLFLYSDHLSSSFHCDAITEMMRVAHEVRVFPLVSLAGSPSPHLNAVIDTAQSAGWQVQLETVAYEFQRGGNNMLRLTRPANK